MVQMPPSPEMSMLLQSLCVICGRHSVSWCLKPIKIPWITFEFSTKKRKFFHCFFEEQSSDQFCSLKTQWFHFFNQILACTFTGAVDVVAQPLGRCVAAPSWRKRLLSGCSRAQCCWFLMAASYCCWKLLELIIQAEASENSRQTQLICFILVSLYLIHWLAQISCSDITDLITLDFSNLQLHLHPISDHLKFDIDGTTKL